MGETKKRTCCCSPCQTERVSVDGAIVGANTSPYRPACNGSTDSPIGKLYQDTKGADIVDKYINVTSATYASDTCGGSFTSTPLQLKYPADTCGSPQCGSITCTGSVPDCYLENDLTVTPDSGLAGNGWELSGQHDFSVCRKQGFKNVQAYKVWHGMFGFDVDPDGLLCSDHASYPTKKYRKIEVDYTTSTEVETDQKIYDITVSPEVYTAHIKYTTGGSETMHFDSIVDIGTGKVTAHKTLPADGNNYSWTTQSYDVNTGDPIGDPIIEGHNNWPQCYNNAPAMVIRTNWDKWKVECDIFNFIFSGGTGPDGVFSGTQSEFETFLASLSATTFGASLSLDTFTLNETTLEIKVIVVGGTASSSDSTYRNDYVTTVLSPSYFHLKVVLSEEYTSEAVYDSAVTLAAEWDLSDDEEYPWRTDNNAFVAPYVSLDEKGPTGPLTNFEVGNHAASDPYWSDYPELTGTWTDPSTVTGDTQGAPLPAGYGQLGTQYGVFDYASDVYFREFCTDAYAKAAELVGEWTPSYLPANASKWTLGGWIAQDTPNIWPCAFAFTDANGVLIQKWAEIQEVQNSYDFARPYGADRFMYDEAGTFYCYDGGTGVLTTTAGSLAANLTLTGIWGGAVVDGFYDGATTDVDGILTLGTKFCDIPTGWTYYNADAASVFGKLRWATAPGFGNRLACTASYDSGADTTTFTIAASPYIISGDKIDIYGGTTNLTVTKISDTQFSVTGNYATATYLVPHAYLVTDPATSALLSGQKYYFANNTPKGDFVYRSWTVKNADSTVTDYDATAACLTFQSNAPSVLYSSPNTETFTNGYSAAFPADVGNGSHWILQFEQWMVDPLAQAAHSPCGGATAIQAPWGYYEARITPPANCGPAQSENAPTPLAGSLNPTLAPPDTLYLDGTGEVKGLIANNPTFPWNL